MADSIAITGIRGPLFPGAITHSIALERLRSFRFARFIQGRIDSRHAVRRGTGIHVLVAIGPGGDTLELSRDTVRRVAQELVVPPPAGLTVNPGSVLDLIA